MIVDVADDGHGPPKRHRRTSAIPSTLIGAFAFVTFAGLGLLTFLIYGLLESRHEATRELQEARRELREVEQKLQTEIEQAQLNKAELNRIKVAAKSFVTDEKVEDAVDTRVSDLSRDVAEAKKTAKGASEKVNKLQRAYEGTVQDVQQLQYVDAKTKLEQLTAGLAETRRMLGYGAPPIAPPVPPGQGGPADYEALFQQKRAEQVRQQQQQQNAYQPAQRNYGKTHYDEAKEIEDPWSDLEDSERNTERMKKVKSEFLFAWKSYKKYAWGHDELSPQSHKYKDWGGPKSKGLALTVIDALSTLWLMGLRNEFEEAVQLVIEKVDFAQDIRVSAFESTIRVIGGMLSAYELSGEKEPKLVEKAAEYMDRLLVAYNTSSGVPHQTLNVRRGTHWSPEWTGGQAVLSEFGSVQLELRTLSYHTGNPLYDMKATHLMSLIKAKCPEDMLCPTMLDVGLGEFRDDHTTLGALGDSFYEYLLKQYLLTGKTEEKYKKMALTSLDSIINHLLRYSTPSRQAYIAERLGGQLDHKMDELACFSGGMFALAAIAIPDSGQPKTFMKAAKELTETCFKMFKNHPTGIAPEIVDFPNGGDFVAGSPYYLLRPETCESIFYMWRATKDQKYRDMQWFIFSHIEKHCKVEGGGYAGIKNVNLIPTELDDQQQSFFLAETLKYIYLTFADDSALDLNSWVFNTEAHPLKIRHRDPLDIWRDWEDEHDGEMPWYPPDIQGVTHVETERMKKERQKNPKRRIPKIDPKSIDEPQTEDDGPLPPEYKNTQAPPQHRVIHHEKARRIKKRVVKTPPPEEERAEDDNGGSGSGSSADSGDTQIDQN